MGTDNTKRFTGDINQPVGPDAAFRLNLMGTDANVANRDGAENRRFGFAPSLALGLGTPTRVNLDYYHITERDTPDYGLPWLDIKRSANQANVGFPAAVSQNNFYGFERGNHINTDADIGTVAIEHELTDSIKLRDQLRYAYYTRERAGDRAPGARDPAGRRVARDLAGDPQRDHDEVFRELPG
ncbi:MAG: hypothetical protein WDO24_09130 [Pseudomonadota bacterium]